MLSQDPISDVPSEAYGPNESGNKFGFRDATWDDGELADAEDESESQLAHQKGENKSHGKRDSTRWLSTKRRTATAMCLQNRVH